MIPIATTPRLQDRSQLALQDSARQRLWRSRPLLDLPRSRRQRPPCVAPALGTRGIRAGAGWGQRHPSIRFGCQLRPQTDVAVIPILQPNVDANFVRNKHRINIVEERYIVSMFVDMRGSTKLARAQLPFDIVFLINRFVKAASKATIDAGGQSNQFIGDGVLPLFGLDVGGDWSITLFAAQAAVKRAR
jgi:hypothetical protein